jgi:Phage Mu protein F like protein
MNRTERRKYAKSTERKNRKWESIFFPKVQRAIKQEISSLIEYMKANGVNSAPFYFDQNLSNGKLTEAVQDLYKRVGVDRANEVTRLLRAEVVVKKGFGFNQLWVNFILDYFRQHLVQYITYGAVQTMREYFLPLISQAITDGKSFAEISREIEESGFARYQAARIVRTEVNGASNLGTRAAGETYQYQTQKEWISANDNRVRGKDPKDHADHWNLDGQMVDFNQPFTDPDNGVELMQPGDPKAKGSRRDRAATVINCRCTHALVPKRDASGRLIKK